MVALSVVLPVRNGEAFLDAAILSVLRQTFGDFELLVVDDGSDDASPAIVARHAASDPRVISLTSPGQGLVAALNFGLAHARAPLVARMDADDVALPRRFERQMERMAAQPELAVLGTATYRIDEAGNRLGMTNPPAAPDAIRRALEGVNPMAHPTVVMRSDVVRSVGGYRPAYLRAEDYDLWLRLAETGRLANLAEPLLEYRLASGFNGPAFARQVLSEMVARQTAALRRAGKVDPTGAWEDISDAGLASIGLDPQAVAQETARRALHMARQFRKLRKPQAVQEALRLADAQPRSGLAEAIRYGLRRARTLF